MRKNRYFAEAAQHVTEITKVRLWTINSSLAGHYLENHWKTTSWETPGLLNSQLLTHSISKHPESISTHSTQHHPVIPSTLIWGWNLTRRWMIFIYWPAPLNIHSFVWYWTQQQRDFSFFGLYKTVCEFQFVEHYQELDESSEGEKEEENPPWHPVHLADCIDL